ncbi:MAG: S8 family serine peptidase [Eubacteriales bacterium]|nr:S8 family serine peptidase [Eubacteriales bacterium]
MYYGYSKTDTDYDTIKKGGSIHLKNWGNADAGANSAGFIAVIDSGIDFNHPDLASVMYHFSPELQKELGCTEFGKVTCDGAKSDLPADDNGHGTHVAGIIAGNWDNHGISGAANGVQLISVKATNNGTGSDADLIKGFKFVLDAKKAGVDIRAVNFSIGSSVLSRVFLPVINALGEAGVLTCKSSGNDGKNVDKSPGDAGVLSSSPYVITVNNSTGTIQKSSSSNYGIKTDIFAFGDSILSSIPTTQLADIVYYPMADPEAYTADTFDFRGEGSSTQKYGSKYGADYKGVRAFTQTYYKADVDEFEFWDIKDNVTNTPIGEIDTESCYDSTGGSLKISSEDMSKSSDGSRSFYLAIPVDVGNEPDLKYANFALSLDYDKYIDDVSVSCVMTGELADAGGAAGSGAAGGDVTGSSAGGDVTGGVSDKYKFMFSIISSEHALYGTNMAKVREDIMKSYGSEIKAGTTPNAIQRVKRTDGLGNAIYDGYVLYWITIKNNPNVTSFNANIDVAGAGYVTTPYDLYNGTSMATPLVTGSAAVIAEENKDTQLAGLSGGAYTAKLKELVLAYSTGYPAFEGLCMTGAQLDLDPDAAMRPVISSIHSGSNENEVVIEGFTFLDEGSLDTGGIDFDIVSWSTNRIVITLKETPQYSMYLFKVTNAEERSAQKYFVPGNAGGNIYEITFTLPDDSFDPADPDFVNDIKNSWKLYGSQQFVNLGNTMYFVNSGDNSSVWRCDPTSATVTRVTAFDGYKILNRGAWDGGNTLFFFASKTEKDASGKEDTYEYILGFDGNAVTEYTYKGVNLNENSGMFISGDYIYLLGGYVFSKEEDKWVSANDIVRMDIVTLDAERIGSMPYVSKSVYPIVLDGGEIYATGIFSDKDKDMQILYKITVNADGSLGFEDISDIVPKGIVETASDPYYAITAAETNFIIAGLRSDDNTDTWFCENGEISAYTKSASLSYLFKMVAGYCNGYLYVAGESYNEADAVVMRASYILDKPVDPVPPEPVVTGGGSGSRERTSIGYGAGNVPNIYYEPAGRWIKDATGWWFSFNTGAYYAIDAAGNTVYYGADGQMSVVAGAGAGAGTVSGPNGMTYIAADGSYMVNGVTYTGPNGNYIKSAWALIKGKWYHFDERGYMQEGFIKDGVKWYYLMPGSGEMAKGLIDPGDGYIYYMSPVDGAMQTGNITVDGIDRYFRSDMPAAPTYTLDPATGIYVRNSVDDIPYGAAIKR